MPSPRLRIVTGKGGVGKSVTATALAVSAARCKKRVLLAEVNAGDRATKLLGARPVGAEMREVLENLYIVDMNPHEAIHEYSLLTLRFEAIYRAVFENRLVRHFIRLIPALAEYVMLGKIWYHEQQRDEDGEPRFDLIILDAPSTGHAVSMLRTPSAIEETVPAGPMKDYAKLIREMLSDPVRTVVNIVTTPEEMPVNEAVNLEQAATDLLGIKVGTTIINQRIDTLPSAAMAALAPLADDAPYREVYEALRIRQGKAIAGEDHLQRLPSYMLRHSVSLPVLAGRRLNREAISHLATLLEQKIRFSS